MNSHQYINKICAPPPLVFTPYPRPVIYQIAIGIPIYIYITIIFK